MELAFGRKPEQLIKDLVSIVDHLPPKISELWHKRRSAFQLLKTGLKHKSSGPVLDCSLDDLSLIPALTCWPEDGGPFITLPLVYTEDPQTRKGNLGMYRIQIQGPKQTGMHIQIHRGGGNHYAKAEAMSKPLDAAVFVGGPPALIIAAVAPLPEDVPELVFASLLQGQKLSMIERVVDRPLPLVAEADFCIWGQIPPHRREDEGPFGDHYGYYSLCHPYPVLEVKHITHRKDAIYPATVVGRPPQEDHFMAVYLQDLFKPLFPLVMKGVRDVFAFEESGVHSVAGALVNERYGRESFTAALRILGEGQLSLTKVLLATDQEVDVRNFGQLLQTILARCTFETDLFVFSNISLDTLDYTGPEVNKGSKALLLGTGAPKYQLQKDVPNAIGDGRFGSASLYVPGCLVVRGPAYHPGDGIPEMLLQMPEIKDFRWVCLHDDPKAATASDAAFLWHIFTRFEPAADIYGNPRVVRNHLSFSAPLVIDCRMKPSYPDILVPDEETVDTVNRIWSSLGIDEWLERRA